MFTRDILPCLLKILSFATVLLSFATILLAQTCSRLKPNPTGVMDDGQYRHKVSQFLDFSLERCVLECILVSACASLEYRENRGLCELGNVTAENADNWNSENTNRYVFIYHDIRNMNWVSAQVTDTMTGIRFTMLWFTLVWFGWVLRHCSTS